MLCPAAELLVLACVDESLRPCSWFGNGTCSSIDMVRLRGFHVVPRSKRKWFCVVSEDLRC